MERTQNFLLILRELILFGTNLGKFQAKRSLKNKVLFGSKPVQRRLVTSLKQEVKQQSKKKFKRFSKIMS